MTDVQRQQIYQLRFEGMGYKAIGAVLGLTRDAVKSYCKRNGLCGDGTVVSLNVEEMKNQNLICLKCGKPVKQKQHGRVRKFCSDDCRRTWWSSNQDKRNKKGTAMYKYTCPHCDKEFSCYGNKNRKYCSHDCYIKSRFWKGGKDGI